MSDSDGLEVRNPQPGYEYHWVRNKPFNILKREAQGYEICTGEDKQSVGDLILARIPLKLAKKRQQYSAIKPIIQERHARGSYYDSIEHTKAESIYFNTFIKPTTLLYKIKIFFRGVLCRIQEH